MKRSSLNASAATLLLLLVTILSCSDSENDPTPQNTDPIITERGTAVGEAVTASVGASGGTIQSGDGKLTVTIPAGALTSNTTISIQSITNEGPQGIGLGYRLAPEGINFSQPVDLTFHYNDQLLNGVPEDFLWIITQASDGSWNAMLKSNIDTNAKTVSIRTTHFSDWTLGKFIDLTVTPAAKTLLVGQSVTLHVTGFLRDQNIRDDDELVPLIPIVGDGDGLTPLTPIPPVASRFMKFRIKEWTLNGVAAPVSNSSGSLTQSGNSTTYTAPGVKPSANPVAVTVSLEGDNKEGAKFGFMVTASITVVDTDLYLLLKIDGETYEYFQYGINAAPPDINNFWLVGNGLSDNRWEMLAYQTINSTDVKNVFGLTFENPTEGTHAFTCYHNDGHDNMEFWHEPGESMVISYSKRELEEDGDCLTTFLCSDATITFLHYTGERNSEVTGYFSATLYEDKEGYGDQCKTPDVHTVEGEFRQILFQ
ncbi:MAG TPA: hypothetical protein VD816_06220 [Ohtaekwangia sp.]|nr:hypothetical protein [Ohtaekwangia sp.]